MSHDSFIKTEVISLLVQAIGFDIDKNKLKARSLTSAFLKWGILNGSLSEWIRMESNEFEWIGTRFDCWWVG